MRNFKSGYFEQQNLYKSFQPNPICRQWNIDDINIFNLASQAAIEIGRLDMFSNYLPDIDYFIEMHIAREANQSSKIEGTNTHFEEVLMDKESINPERRDDWQEVHNYINALNHGIARLGTLPLSSRLICEIHEKLLNGVRGKYKNPGEFRRSQNWIGGASISDARFIPPVWDTVGTLMGDIEKFIHSESIILPELIKIGIIHYQFETIHPFLDGNGRVGRLLIPLYLIDKQVLRKPVLYLSSFFEKNRTLYYDNLMLARMKNDMSQWLKFFLTGVIETSKLGVKTFEDIMALQKDISIAIGTLGKRAKYANIIINGLYRNPNITPKKISELCKVSLPYAYKITKDLESINILTRNGNTPTYSFERYISIFKGNIN